MAVPTGLSPKHRRRHSHTQEGGPEGRGQSGSGKPPPPRLPPHPPPSQGPPAGSREPGARRPPPPASRLGGVSSSAHCSPPSAAPPGPSAPPARSWGRKGGGGRRGRDRSRRSRWPGLSRADTARDAAVRRSSAAWLRASVRLCRSSREEGPPERNSGAASHRPAAGSAARPPPGAPTLSPPGPSAKPAATCSGPEARTRCAPCWCSRGCSCCCRRRSSWMVSGGPGSAGTPVVPRHPRPGQLLGKPPRLVARRGAAPPRTISWGHARSPDFAPSKPLPTRRTPQASGRERWSSRFTFGWKGGGLCWDKQARRRWMGLGSEDTAGLTASAGPPGYDHPFSPCWRGCATLLCRG